jgi:hypothetical protein
MRGGASHPRFAGPVGGTHHCAVIRQQSARSLDARGAGAARDASDARGLRGRNRHNALPATDAQRPVTPLVARVPSPRPPACGWGCAAGRRAPASTICAGLVGASVLAATSRLGRCTPLDCAGRYLQAPWLGGITRFAQPAPHCPFLRQPPAARRRDRQAGGWGCAPRGRRLHA